MRRKLRPLAALAMVALIGVGCSNEPAGNGSSGGNTNATSRDKAVKFAERMRENGVREFPDSNAAGEFAYGIKKGSSLDPSSAAWKKAIGACKDLQPPGALGDGKQSAEETCRRDSSLVAGSAEGESLREVPPPVSPPRPSTRAWAVVAPRLPRGPA
jgi:hypothetical protein